MGKGEWNEQVRLLSFPIIKMKKQKMTQEQEDSRVMYIIVGIVIIAMALVAIWDLGEKYYEKKMKEEQQKGVDLAEVNCLKLICTQTQCDSLEKIDYLQNYCKSLVYGTDFYLKYKKWQSNKN